MPLSLYDAAYGGKPGSAAEARARMIKQYGRKKGLEVFYATANARSKSPLRQQMGKGSRKLRRN